MSVFCILLAPPRSGTTMLGDAVSRAFQVAWPQEVFHADYADPGLEFKAAEDIKQRCNFFNFRHDLFKRHPELSFPSEANQSHIFEAYLEYLVSSEANERFLLDVKYPSWHHLNHYWYWPPYQPPYLLKEAIRLQLPIVHLKRANLFALYCSQKLAETTGIWSTFESRAESDAELTVDLPDCLQSLKEAREREALFDRWLSSYQHWDLRYESLLTPGGFSEETARTFAEIFGAAPQMLLETDYRKVTPPLCQVVANKDEVLSALRGTDFEAMAEEALG